MRTSREEPAYIRLFASQQVRLMNAIALLSSFRTYIALRRSTMAWGLEARVPFLDKAFLEVAMNVNPKEKMFNKGSQQQLDADGRPRMEKVRVCAKK